MLCLGRAAPKPSPPESLLSISPEISLIVQTFKARPHWSSFLPAFLNPARQGKSPLPLPLPLLFTVALEPAHRLLDRLDIHCDSRTGSPNHICSVDRDSPASHLALASGDTPRPFANHVSYVSHPPLVTL